MSDKKFEIAREYVFTVDGIEPYSSPLYRIRALKDFETVEGKEVKCGDLGGWVSGEHNLSQEGRCWIADEAEVLGGASIEGDALVCDSAVVRCGPRDREPIVMDCAKVASEAVVAGDVEISGDAFLHGSCGVFENARIGQCAEVDGEAIISGEAEIFGDALVLGDTFVGGSAKIGKGTVVSGDAKINEGIWIGAGNISKSPSMKEVLEHSVDKVDRGSDKVSPTKNQER